MRAFSIINNLDEFQQIRSLSPELFKRYCGVKPDTFVKICEFVRDQLRRVQKKPGRPCKLAVEDQVLLTLEYWREYPTQFHLAKRWQLSEATVSRTIVKIENLLKNCDDLKLPSKKVLRESENAFKFVIVDVTETPLERPKKNKRTLFGQEKAAHDKNADRHCKRRLAKSSARHKATAKRTILRCSNRARWRLPKTFVCWEMRGIKDCKR